MNRPIFAFLFLIFSILDVQVKAAEAVIVDVRKNLQMSKAEKVYRHYFINGGSQLGLAKGSQVDVLRRLPVFDPLKNSSIGDMRVKVGTLEIIQSDDRLSVGRMISMESPEVRAVLDYEAFMVGDRLDLGTIKKIALLDKKANAKDLITEGKRHIASLESAGPAQTNDPQMDSQRLMASTGKAATALAAERAPASIKTKAKTKNKKTKASKKTIVSKKKKIGKR